MPLLLARIDDRLIHGQVAHGWGRALRPTLLAIVSAALRDRPVDAELYLMAAPDGAAGCVVTAEEASAPAFRGRVDRERTILLLPDTQEALALVEAGFPLETLNLGGLHFAEGKRELYPYVFLDREDAARLRRLRDLGVKLVAQDLPANPAHPVEAVLDEANWP